MSEAPTIPALDYAFTISAQIGPVLSAGLHAQGERLHIPILSGQVNGPRLQGKIMPGGSDWPLIRPDGTSEIAASYTILAEDGTPILVHNRGLRASSPEVLKRLRRGETVSPSEYYFYATPVFEAPEGPHHWLRDTIFVASLAPRPGGIDIAVYAVR
jgi:hypothetical protein